MEFDKDLRSIQEVRNLTKSAKAAQKEFKQFTQAQVDSIVKAMADAGYANAERLAKMACEETGFGKMEDKVLKNRFATRNVYDSIRELKTVGVIDVQDNGRVLKIAEPMGVVAALIPSTNPTSTLMFKAIISLKCRNAMVASPHPRSAKSTMEALDVVRTAAEKAGAPKGLLHCLTEPTIAGTEELMKSDNTAVILATGSNPMVKAAYSAGTPAYGVGSGNVPSFIEKTADVEKAVKDIIHGTTFDNGTLCSSEQAMIVDISIAAKAREIAKKNNAYFVNAEEKIKLEKVVSKNGRINPDIVGKPAAWIAKHAGINAPENTSVLIADCKGVGVDEPLSMEKLSPILAFYEVDGWLEGCHKCIDLLTFGGIGHTMSIHSNNREVIMKFALEKPAFRIVVNTPSSLGAVGFTTSLLPSLTLGVGTWGGSIISENVSAKHLMNVKTVAFEANTINPGKTVGSFENIKMSDIKAAGFLDKIEEHLIARAGNPSTQSYAKPLFQQTEKKGVMGSNITEAEIEKILKEFNS